MAQTPYSQLGEALSKSGKLFEGGVHQMDTDLMEPETDEESLDLLAEFGLALIFLVVFVGVLFGRFF